MAEAESRQVAVKLKITRAEALPPTRLRIEWANGDRSEVDIGEYLKSPGHEPLRDPTFFTRVQVEEWGHGIEWPQADIGIPADAAPYVFERFFCGDKARTGGGFGLGLSIVEWIAESHGGTVKMESQPSQGSTFTVSFPR